MKFISAKIGNQDISINSDMIVAIENIGNQHQPKTKIYLALFDVSASQLASGLQRLHSIVIEGISKTDFETKANS